MVESSFCLGQQCNPQVPEWPGRELQDQVWEPPLSLSAMFTWAAELFCASAQNFCGFCNSQRVTLQCWTVVWLRWAGRLSALLTVTCRHPNPSVIAPGLTAGMCPTCFALHLSQSCPQLQNNLAPFITTTSPGCYTLCELPPHSPVAHCQAGNQKTPSNFPRAEQLETFLRQYLSRFGGAAALLMSPSCPSWCWCGFQESAAPSHPGSCPAQPYTALGTLPDSAYHPNICDRMTGRQEGGFEVGWAVTWFACLLMKKILQEIMCLSLVTSEGERFSS